MAELILASSGKGGVGKTTVCAHLSVALAGRGYRTLLVETDAGFRSMDLLFALEATVVYDLADILAGRCQPPQAAITHSGTGVSMILAPGDPVFSPSGEALDAFCRWAAANYDFVIFDGAAGFGPVQEAFAARCTLSLIITLPELTAARAAARVSGLLRRVGATNQRLIINRITTPFLRTPKIDDLDDLIDLVGAQLLGAIPEEPRIRPPGHSMGDSLAGHELDRIAQRLLGEYVDLVLYR